MIAFLRRLPIVVLAAIAVTGCRPEAVAPCGTDFSGEPVCGVGNPEDLARFGDTPWLVFPQKRGSVIPTPLALLNINSKLLRAPDMTYPDGPAQSKWGEPLCDTPPPLPEYRGIDVRGENDGTYRLAAINGSARQRIELFTATADNGSVSLAWVGCVNVPELWFLNDVAIGPNGQLFATHMFYRQTGLRRVYLMLKFLLGIQTGYAVHWSPETGWRRVRNSTGSFPNGIAVSPTGSTVYMASTYDSRISRIDIATGERKDAVLTVRPDNLTWTDHSSLIAAGGTGTRMFSTQGCDTFVPPGCGFPFAVTEIDANLSKRRTLYAHDQQKIPGASVAIQAGNSLFLGSAFADRITVVTP